MRLGSNGFVTQGFSAAHPAVDLAYANGDLSYNSPIYAPESGKVTYVGQMGSGTLDAGLVVQITNGNRVHRLCHLASYSVSVGQQVTEGQQVARMGYSGYVIDAQGRVGTKAGTHLHQVMEINGQRVDARNYVTSAPSAGGQEMFQNDNEVKQAYLMLRGNEGTAAERAGWIGQSKQRFFQVARAEADSYRKQLADVKTALANEQKKPPKEVVKIVEKIVDRPVEVIKEVKVGEDEAIKGFFSRLVDKLIFWSKK